MPNMDGYEVCQRLRADPVTADVLIVILTARASLADRTAGIEAGADLFLVKPITIAELGKKIEGLLTRQALRQQ